MSTPNIWALARIIWGCVIGTLIYWAFSTHAPAPTSAPTNTKPTLREPRSLTPTEDLMFRA